MKKSLATILATAALALFGCNQMMEGPASVNVKQEPAVASAQLEDVCYVQGEVEDFFRYATTVVDSGQGLKKNGSPVNPGRSNAAQGLSYDAAQSESSFYSLGMGGWIIVGFTYPIFNGPGVDLRLTEDTWGTYPLEKAEVYVSQDGVTWLHIGTADNTSAISIHTVSEFDLDVVALPWAKFVKVVDVSPAAGLPSDADGYDLNAVEALYSGVECPPPVPECWQTETAWGFGGKYNTGKKGNWATYVAAPTTDPVTLFAGQNIDAGTVAISAGGLVTITLANGWMATGYHIQGYDAPPSGNPAPGQFEYSGDVSVETPDSFDVPITFSPYVGVHLEVRKAMDCPEE
jgi:hypothetical protein